MRSILRVLVTLLAIAGFPAHALASWGTAPAGPHVPVCTLTGNKPSLNAVSDGAGGVIVAWIDPRPGATTDVYAQRISAAGVPLWTANGVIVCNAAGNQDQLEMVSDGAGGAILVWSDLRSGTGRDIWAQRLNASGVRQWTSAGVQVTSASNDQDLPRLDADGSGGAVICWRDKRGATSSADVYAQRLSAAGALLWTNSGFTSLGVPVVTLAGSQLGRIAADGTGGAFVAWGDSASGNYDLRIQRLAAATGLDMWTSAGVVVIADASYQVLWEVVADGLGGVLVSWEESSPHYVHAQRFDANGTKLWYTDGWPISGFIDDKSNRHTMIADGTGGLFGADGFSSGALTVARYSAYGLAAWNAPFDSNVGSGYSPVIDMVADGAGGIVGVAVDAVGGVSAWRLNGLGASQWSSAGEPIQRMTYTAAAVLVATTDSHFILVWMNSLGGYEIFAERFDLEGVLGAPEPVIAGVDDVANDQGRREKVAWNRSDRDTEPLRAIVDYRLWRSVPTSAPLFAALAARRGVTADPDEAAATGQLFAGAAAAAGYAWELAGTQAAATLASYSLVVDTEADSLAGANPWTVFMVEARAGTSLGSAHWFSAPDSGYSVDDLPPAQPAPFAASFAPGSTSLHWGANTEPDLAGYRVYRGTNPAFALDATSFVAETADTALTDAAASPYYYKLVAVDTHGNVSPWAFVRPDGALDAPASGRPMALALSAPAPHPVRAGGGALVRFALPAAGPVSLRLYDTQGRVRATLAEGERAAGEHTLAWPTAARAVPAGVYFLRLETAAGQRACKVTITD